MKPLLPYYTPALVTALAGTLALVMLSPSANSADKTLEGIACRSVHLSYRDVPDAAVFYNEVKVEQSAEGTYFCVCGFSRGYYGIQEQARGRKVVIFSVWDPGQQNDPNSVTDDQRVKLLHNDPKVLVKRFGNEGTGGQSFLEFDWQIGQTYRFMVAARRNADRTEYASFFFHPTESAWKHLVTFSTLTDDTSLRGYYAFVEDFRRNRESATKTRRATYSNAWVRDADGKWSSVESARFTGDSNPVLNINAGINDGQFYLATGGDIRNDDVALNSMMTRPVSGESVPGQSVAGPPRDADAVLNAFLQTAVPPTTSR